MAKKKKAAKQPTAADDSVDFEQALAEVESIVDKLESGEMGLTDSLQQYELGIKRLKQCHALLQKAERRVSLLSGVDADGNSISEPFEVDDHAVPDAPPQNPKRKSPPGGGSGTQGSVDDLPGLF